MQAPNLIGQTLGNYRLTHLLGMGGMAAVYASYQTTVKRPVAIKVLPTLLAQESGYVERFLREVELAAKLEHPHILPIYDYGTDKGVSYIVMRLLTGGALDARIREFGKPSYSETLQTLTQIADALDYAHRRGIIHRDLKTSNILFDDIGNAYLSDFGIAKALEGKTSSLTGTGQVMGTPAYMAPEQWRGEAVDERADIYAFGVMVYQLLTGHLPFSAPTPHALMYKHLSETPPPPALVDPSLPIGVDQILAKALAKNPAERYAKASEMVQALRQVIQNNPNYQPQMTGFFQKPLTSVQPTPAHIPHATGATARPMGGAMPTPPTNTITGTRRQSTAHQATNPNYRPYPTQPNLGANRPHPQQNSRLILGILGILVLTGAGLVLFGLLSSSDSSQPEIASPDAPVVNVLSSSPTVTEELPTDSPSQTPTIVIDVGGTQTAQAIEIQGAIGATQTELAQQLTLDAVANPSATATFTRTPIPSNTARPANTPRPIVVTATEVAQNRLCDNGLITPRLRVNDRAYVLTDPPVPNVVRSGAGLDSRRTDLIEPGESFLVVDGPICEDGIIWWRVRLNSGEYGWTGEGEDYYWVAPLESGSTGSSGGGSASLPSCPEAPRTQLGVGEIAIVDFNSGGSLRISSTPLGENGGTDTIIEVYDNARLDILDGPLCGSKRDRWRWYVRDQETGIEGWASEGIAGDRWMCPTSNPECGN